MSYVLRTDKLSKPHYFVGLVEGEFFGTVTGISPIVFNAMEFDTDAEAIAAIEECDLGSDWTVSEVFGADASEAWQ